MELNKPCFYLHVNYNKSLQCTAKDSLTDQRGRPESKCAAGVETQNCAHHFNQNQIPISKSCSSSHVVFYSLESPVDTRASCFGPAKKDKAVIA